MFTKLVLILSLLTTSAHAANVPQAASVVNLCGTVGSNSSALSASIATPLQTLVSLGYKVLHVSFNSGPTAARFWSFKDMSSMTGAAYFIPSGNKFYVSCMSGVSLSATSTPFQLVSSTAVIAADDTATVPTGAIYSGNASGNYGFLSGIATTSLTQPLQYNYPFIFDATAANLYLSVQVGTGFSYGGITMVGKVAP